VIIWETDSKNRRTNSPVSSSDFIDWKDQTRLFEEIAPWRFLFFNLTGKDEPERVQGLTVSASFLPLLGAQIQLGRTFLPEEEQIGHNKVVVLSDALWRRRFATDPSLVGQKIDIEGEPHTVVGILAPSFQIFHVLNRPLDSGWDLQQWPLVYLHTIAYYCT
jgi:putative ABC transport system permease protein